MSNTNEAIEAFAQKETEWKTQLSTLRNKLTQAGSHLKTLTQENARLNKQVNEFTNKESTWNKERDENSRIAIELVTALEKVFGHQSPVPDVSSPTKLEHYARDAEKHFSTKLEHIKNEVAEKSKEDKKELEKLKKENEKLSEQLKAALSKKPSSSTVDSSSSTIESVQQSIHNLTEDLENGTIDSSLPPTLLQSFENLRSNCVDQLLSLNKEKRTAESAQNVITNLPILLLLFFFLKKKDLKRQSTLLQLSVNNLSEEKEKVVTEKDELLKQLEQSKHLKAHSKELEEQLKKTEKQKQESELRVKNLQVEHQNLISKLSHLKETLAPRLEADKALRQRVSELTAQLESTEHELSQVRTDMLKRDKDASDQLHQQERELAQLQSQILQVQHERDEWQENATQFEAQRNQLDDEHQRIQGEFNALHQKREVELKEHEFEKSSLANLQIVLEEFQASKDSEVRAAVEHIQRQLDITKKACAEYQERARVAEGSLEQYQQDVAKTQRYEQEIKEKNLLIGKLRHEAIILNEHLIEAMRRLKEESNDSNVDRQLISNLIIGFLVAPRGDQKRFEILNIIASILQMSDEQKEHIGLLRPNKNPQSPNASPLGWTAASQQQQNSDTQQSFTDAWISFLLKESNTFHPGKDNKNKSTSEPTSPGPNKNVSDI
ncbi:hypothetical protein INT45_003877 [Circinella minor]|uniref:GRIP domain-containing protein n=1 Tax=Circinella minor TaxID=1195481 RepID=A0A8H7SD74_9FUNG|nr:hypothetical protein INT45_003877 [Circinella minor]